MELQPTITFEQYQATYRAIAAAKPHRVRKRSWRELVLLAVLCLGLGISLQIDVTRVPAITLYGAMILCWMSSKPLNKALQNRQLRCFYDEEKCWLNDQTLIIDESGISCDQRDGHATSHRAWQGFVSQIDMDDAFLFLPSPNAFVRLPKEMLTQSDQKLIREWSSSIPKTK